MIDLQNLELLTQDDEVALASLGERKDDMVRQTIDWAKINTGSWNKLGLDKLSKKILSALSVLDADAELIDLPTIKKVGNDGQATHFKTASVIHAQARPDADVQLILTGHYDTVFPDGTFVDITDIGDGKLNGPGLADMKGGLVVMLEALKTFEQSPLKSKIGYRIVLTPDEEIGNFASSTYLEAAAKDAHIGLTFEPAMETGAMSGARKGSAIFNIVFEGRSAHAGRNPHDGRSAIYAAASFVTHVEQLEHKVEGVTFNVGKIDGGGANNIVPDLAIVRMGVRAPDAESAKWATEKLSELFDKTLSRDGIKGQLSGGFYRPPKPRNKAQTALFDATHRTGKALNLDLTFHDTGGVCEGNNVFAAGTPNIDTLGVRGGRIHSHDEFVMTDSFVERASLTALLLNRLADGRINAAYIKSLMRET